MNIVDFIVLLIIFIFLAIVIFVRYLLPKILKKDNKNGCSCCPMAYDKKANRFLKDYRKSNKK